MVAVKIDWVIDWDELNKAIVLIVGSEDPASLDITGADVDGLPDDCIIAAGSVLVTPTANYIAFEDGQFTKKSESGGGGSSIQVESLSVTENNTYTAPEGKAYSPVTVNVPTGAVNIVAGTFTGTTAGAMDVSIPYSGSGFPLMFAIYVPYLANSGFASARRANASGAIICVKGNANTPQYTDTDDSKMFIGNIYKGNDMAFISNLSLGWMTNRQVFNTSGASATAYDLVKFKDNKTFSVYISGTSGTDGFVDNVEYAYVVIYSS